MSRLGTDLAHEPSKHQRIRDQDNDFNDEKRVSISIHPLLPTCLQSNNAQYMGPELACHKARGAHQDGSVPCGARPLKRS